MNPLLPKEPENQVMARRIKEPRKQLLDQRRGETTFKSAEDSGHQGTSKEAV
jgi:hypothetical protein